MIRQKRAKHAAQLRKAAIESLTFDGFVVASCRKAF
jgi:hypothetical protein